VATSTDWVFVALGSNVGDRDGYLGLGRRRLTELPETEFIAASRVETTEPIGPGPQGAYLNQMVLLRTALSPSDLLARCQAIEREAGRVRSERWGPRTLDVDIVRFARQVVEDPDLRVPHPELPHRDFWQREIEELERLTGGRA
jgi:2-amino-4-hydroxy-6-hydroxymethyldihydropteridine diphosphokinase